MTTEEFIIALFCRVDDDMLNVPKHSQSKLYPSEIVTLGLLYALKGVGERPFYRWLKRDYKTLFPKLPDCTRLFRLLKTHRDWNDRFLAIPSLLGVADTFGIELLHPMREGRRENQLGAKGLSNHRWIIGAKLGVVLNHLGLVVAWDCNQANVFDTEFHPLIAQFQDLMVVLTDTGFHSKTGDPTNIKICRRGTWNTRMMIETVFSMLTNVCHLKKIAHRVADYFRSRMAFILAAFNLLVQWNGFQPDADGFVHLSIAEFSL
ncbi:MAG: transposase [Chloroflexi bacterium]|nr:transposase [Chloroflexota bacterium]